MSNEHGEWVTRALSEDDPGRLRSAAELEEYIERVGFLPLFANGVKGFSVEEHTAAKYWWSGDAGRDPWEWRMSIAGSGRMAYGKLFDKRAGFISLKWFPRFLNLRRDGYDFDALWDDGKVRYDKKRIMDLFTDAPELFSYELRRALGSTERGGRNFEGITAELQNQTYLIVGGFRQRLNKKGVPYGWPITLYTTPEHRFGADFVLAAYEEPPEASRAAVYDFARGLYPDADRAELARLLK